MSVDLRACHWPYGDLTERRAIFVYEGARMQAVAMDAPIVPEPWGMRDKAFRAQFLSVIDMMCGPDRKTSPEGLHNVRLAPDATGSYADGWRDGDDHWLHKAGREFRLAWVLQVQRETGVAS